MEGFYGARMLKAVIDCGALQQHNLNIVRTLTGKK